MTATNLPVATLAMQESSPNTYALLISGISMPKSKSTQSYTKQSTFDDEGAVRCPSSTATTHLTGQLLDVVFKQMDKERSGHKVGSDTAAVVNLLVDLISP
uniref:Uncharacterized protein n=1 Tax=Heterorhabditis bacteriophora TaxID=37862 RepID=A0A1I7WXW5_HETBA